MTTALIKLDEDELFIDPRPTTQAVAVYDNLRRDIRSGALAPGLPLRTEVLKSRYQTGVSPLREALARLAAEHLVTAEGKRGFRVAPVWKEDFHQLIAIRKDLEARALELSMAHGNDDWEASIVSSYHKLTKTSPPGLVLDAEAEELRERRHRAIHHALLSACGSHWLLRFCDQLTAHLERYRRIMTPRSKITKKVAAAIEDEHKLLMESVIARDYARAWGVLDSHRDRTYTAIQSAFDQAAAD